MGKNSLPSKIQYFFFKKPRKAGEMYCTILYDHSLPPILHHCMQGKILCWLGRFGGCHGW